MWALCVHGLQYRTQEGLGQLSLDDWWFSNRESLGFSGLPLDQWKIKLFKCIGPMLLNPQEKKHFLISTCPVNLWLAHWNKLFFFFWKSSRQLQANRSLSKEQKAGPLFNDKNPWYYKIHRIQTNVGLIHWLCFYWKQTCTIALQDIFLHNWANDWPTILAKKLKHYTPHWILQPISRSKSTRYIKPRFR
jgi:hypothetical protein